MHVRKNATSLLPDEREALVKAFVLLKAETVNPDAPTEDQYSRWDEFVAIHALMQKVDAPCASFVNFGHGGLGAYAFLAWHRFFLHLFERALQAKVPGVTLPYWDWAEDPMDTLLVTDYMGGTGDPSSSHEVRQGWFAREAPGTGANVTPRPAWWPSLAGWTVPPRFPDGGRGLRRDLGDPAALPSQSTIASALAMTTFRDFQAALESGMGLKPPHGLHNALHRWFGFGAQMSRCLLSPFDPMFYLHHCNVDRLWAMWQADGHATEFPESGGKPHHRRGDPMYPWVGAPKGYSSLMAVHFPAVVVPDFRDLGVKTPADVLDHAGLGYTYDTLADVDVVFDRSDFLHARVPDPMTTAAADVTRLDALDRALEGFFQDCTVIRDAAAGCVASRVRSHDVAGAGASALGPGAAAQRPGERLLVLSFGTPVEDGPIVTALAKGSLLPSGRQLFHGESAGAVDAFLTGALGTAAGFSPIAATAIELFAGEFTHFDFLVTSAEDTLFVTVQGMDFDDERWTYLLVGPDGVIAPGDAAAGLAREARDIATGHAHGNPARDGRPVVTAHQCRGRLSAVVRRNGAPRAAWGGMWSLLLAWRAATLDAMVMFDPGGIVVPIAAGPLRGPRYSRLLHAPCERKASRAIPSPPRHRLDIGPVSTGRESLPACSAVVQVHARTRLRAALQVETDRLGSAQSFAVTVRTDLVRGSVSGLNGFGRLVGPASDVRARVSSPAGTSGSERLGGDSWRADERVLLLARLEQEMPCLADVRDEELTVVSHHGGAPHVHVRNVTIPGVYHVGIWLEGLYHADTAGAAQAPGAHGAHSSAVVGGERFLRVLSASVGVRM